MKKIINVILTLCIAFTPLTAQTGERPTLLFDAEILSWINNMAEPLLKTADLDPKDAKVYIINSDEVNAFVTPEKNIFFYTGLLLKAQSAEEVQGVLAHEIGHIKGEHYLKHLASANNQRIPLLIGTALAVGAAALGSAEGATAMIAGGLASSQDQALRYSRSHENQADKIAAKLLNENGFSAENLISFFKQLRTTNLLYSYIPPQWLLTHPLPKSRISAMEAHVKGENHKKLKNHLDEMQFKRIQAKLIAFTKPKGYLIRKYSYQKSEDALYALTLNAALEGKIDQAINMAENMTVSSKSLPFQYELLAQLYLDKAEYKKADEYYAKSLEANPKEELIRLQKARNQITLGEYDNAISNLKNIALTLQEFSPVYKSIGMAYGKQGNLFESHINLAKEASIKERKEDVDLHLKLAEKYMEKNNSKQATKLANTKELLSMGKKG